MIKIKLNGTRCPTIEDEHGNDLLKKLEDQKVYVSELVIFVKPGGSSMRVTLDMHDAEIEIPEEIISWRKMGTD